MAEKTASYKVTGAVRHDGVDVPVGGIIELTPSQAEQLLALGDVEPASEAAAVVSKKAQSK